MNNLNPTADLWGRNASAPSHPPTADLFRTHGGCRRGLLRPIPLALALGAGVIVLGCKSQETSPQESVVRIVPKENDEASQASVISLKDYRRALARVRFEREDTLNAKPLPKPLKKFILDELINERLLNREADRLGVRPSTTAVDKEMLSLRDGLPQGAFEERLVETYQTESEIRQALTQRLRKHMLLQQEVFKKVIVTPEDILRAWRKMSEEDKMRAPRVRAAQIVLRTRDEAKEVLRALNKKADFATLARQKSIAPEGRTGGELGWFEPKVMPKIFDETCFQLKPGKLSAITPSDYGFHIFKVIEREEARELRFEEIRPTLLKQLTEERQRQAQAEYLSRLRNQVTIIYQNETAQKLM